MTEEFSSVPKIERILVVIKQKALTLEDPVLRPAYER